MRVPGIAAVQHRIDRWAAASQQQSRRNAMVALTALTQRRAELIEVEEYLATLDPSPAHEIATSAANG